VLYEAATNAGKYRALSADVGRVDISWRHQGDIVTITWTEHRGPAVQPPNRHGFGSMVIDSMAKSSLIMLPRALAWRSTCPAANVLEIGT
jgi:two-component sensor histidine kinase